MSQEKKIVCDTLRIDGMTCSSCEVLIERKFKTVPGVIRVNINHSTGRCTIYSDPTVPIRLNKLRDLIQSDGYRIQPWSATEPPASQPSENKRRRWAELGVVALIVFALYSLLKALGIFNLASAVESSLSLGAVFLIGLVAATSTCIAVVGGLVLGLSAQYNEAHQGVSTWQRLKPHFLFNLGRLASYFILGGVIGAIGKNLTPSPRFTGFLTVGISIVMILLAIDILQLFRTKKFIPRMPKWISHKLHDLSTSDKPLVPLLLGGLTFFLPCGFTQSMQLYALTTGSFWKGALTMLVFALGTLPALLGIGMMSTFSRGTIARYFLKFSGVVVLMLGFYNLNNGLTLTGMKAPAWLNRSTATAATSDSVLLENGKQVVTMAVQGLRYTPSSLTIQQGIPVEWRIDGSQAQGCARVITIPKLGLTEYLSPTEETVITFTPSEVGTLTFTCTMGMTNGQFIVVENTSGQVSTATPSSTSNAEAELPCDPASPDCEVQTVAMEISKERGFYPNEFSVKARVPVVFTIDDQVPLGGCMGTLVIPQYNIAKTLTLGENTITFTPTAAGRVPFTCSMGSQLGAFTVIE